MKRKQKDYQYSNETYFASGPVDDVIDRCESELDQWGNGNATSPFFSKLLVSFKRNINYYYSCIVNNTGFDTSIEYVGDQGEYAKVRIPIARTLIRQFVSLTTKQRLVFECLTDINDVNPMITAKIGKAICNQIVEKQNIDAMMSKIAERVCVLGTFFVSCIWRSDKGYIFGKTVDNNPVYSGDVHFETHDMNDIIFDWSVEDHNNLDWIIIKRAMNKWDLCTQFPTLADKIKDAPTAQSERQAQTYFQYLSRSSNDDMIYVREFYHKPTPSVPFGRMTIFIDSDCILYDALENPYGCLPIVPFMNEKITSTGLGYPLLSSLLPASEIYDMCISTVSSNIEAFGVQSILIPKGSDISVHDIRGKNLITYKPQSAEGGGKPEAMQLTASPPDAIPFSNLLESKMGSLSMINDTLRGNPPPNVSSGAMAATLSANSLEFLNEASKNLTIGFEKLFNIAIESYKKFATVEQLVDVVGENQFAFAKEFKTQDIKNIKKIKIRTQSPLMNSISGRLQLGEALMPLLQGGDSNATIKYLGLLNGEPVDALYEIQYDELMAAKQECDALVENRPVFPLMTDNHPIFIRELQKLIYNPIVRINTALSGQVTQVIQQRMQMELQLDPNIKAMTRGQQPPPMPPPPMPPSQAGGPPPNVNQPNQGGQFGGQPNGMPSAPAQPAPQ